MSKTPAKKTETPARERFLELLAGFDPIELCRMANEMKDHYEVLIAKCRQKIVMVERFPEIAAEYPGKPSPADYVQKQSERILAYQKVIVLCDAWRDAEREWTLPGIVAAIKGRRP